MQQRLGSSDKKPSERRARSNGGRKDASTKAIEAKVLVLEEIVEKRRQLMDKPPSSMAQFRNWVDPALGLKKIGSPSTTDPNLAKHNSKLIERAYTAMKQISSMRAERKRRVYVPVGRRADKLGEELAQMREENLRLVSEVLMFKHRYNVATEKLRELGHDKELAENQLNQMRADYVQATNAKPRRVK